VPVTCPRYRRDNPHTSRFCGGCGAGLEAQGHGLSFGRSMAFHPLVDLLRRAFAIEETDSAPAIIGKIERGLALLGEDLDGDRVYLAARSTGSPANAGTTSRAKRRRDSRPPALLTSTYSAPTSRSVWSFAAISSGVP
jgi:hypothetical protein